jgi:hypothetical protein
MAGPCNLSRSTTLDSDFEGSPGQVTLNVKGVGVQFQRAIYNGTNLSPMPSSQIKFAIVAGKTELEVVYRFVDTVNGSGVLAEDCNGSTDLAEVTAGDPAVTYFISA